MGSTPDLQQYLSAKARKDAVSVTGRAELPPTFGPDETAAHLRAVEDAVSGLKQSGGLMIVAHEPKQRQDAALLLLSLSARLAQAGPVRWIDFLTDASAALKEDAPYLIVHDAPRFADLDELLSQLGPGVVLIASGEHDAWASVNLDRLAGLSVARNVLTGQPDEAREVEAVAAVEGAAVSSAGAVVVCVAVADALGAPLPISLVARAAQWREDAIEDLVEDPSSPLYWSHTRGENGARITLRSEAVAWRFVSAYYAGRESAWTARLAELEEAIAVENDAERLSGLKLVEGLVRRGRYVAAREIAGLAHRRALTRFGSSAERLAWGKLCTRVFRFEDADAVFASAIAADPANVYLLHARAHALGQWAERQPEKVEAARRAFRALLDADTQNAVVRHAWAVFEAGPGGDRVLALSELDAAEALASRRPDRFPRATVMVHVARANLERLAGRAERALRLLEAAPKSDDLYVRHLLGVTRVDAGDYGGARAVLEHLLQEVPGHLVTLHALAVMALDRGHLAEAGEWLDEGLRLSPQHPLFLHARAQRLEELRQYDQAIEDLRMVRRLDQGNVRVEVSLGVTLAKAGSLALAETHFRNAAQRDPHNPYPYVAWANVLLSAEARDSVRTALQRVQDLLSLAATRAADAPAVLTARARLEAVHGRMPHARELLEAALRARAVAVVDFIIIRNTWAQLETRAGNLAEARAQYGRALALDPENAFTLRALGRFLLEKSADAERGRECLGKAEQYGLPVEFAR